MFHGDISSFPKPISAALIVIVIMSVFNLDIHSDNDLNKKVRELINHDGLSDECEFLSKPSILYVYI